MPTYLVHGFRWPRPLIRIHIILQNLDDAAAEWLVAPGTTATLLDNFEELYPEITNNLPNLRFIEQYDPNDMSVVSQPYAYVADIVHEIKLGIDIDEVRGKGVSNDQWGSILELRDKLAPEEKVGWYVVVCGDELRSAPSIDESVENGDYVQNVPYTPPMQNIPYRPQTSDSKSVKTSADTKSMRSVRTTSTDHAVRRRRTPPDTKRILTNISAIISAVQKCQRRGSESSSVYSPGGRGKPDFSAKYIKRAVADFSSRQNMRNLQSAGSNHSFEPAPPVPALPPGVRMTS